MPTNELSYLTEQELVDIHRKIIGHTGGMPGIRDRAALETCVAQPKTAVFGEERFPTVFDKAAAYCFFIVRAHPFFDGNKRTGLSASVVFLLDHGVEPVFDKDEMYDAICQVVTGELDIEDLAQIFRKAAQR